uniref:Uncharacterized protein n=1 Tax=Panagrolaimus davidi TaxID=227884 RepID=A0A914QA04_9BILA
MDSSKVLTHPPPSDFPSDILKWMKKKDKKPPTLLKLVKISKYFQSLRFFPVKAVQSFLGPLPWYITLNNERINLNSVEEMPNRLWITEKLSLLSPAYIIYEKLLSNLAFCEAKEMYFADQKITFKEYKILTAGKKVEYLRLTSTTLKYENGIDIYYEDFIKFLPKIKKFFF